MPCTEGEADAEGRAMVLPDTGTDTAKEARAFCHNAEDKGVIISPVAKRAGPRERTPLAVIITRLTEANLAIHLRGVSNARVLL